MFNEVSKKRRTGNFYELSEKNGKETKYNAEGNFNEISDQKKTFKEKREAKHKRSSMVRKFL